MIWKQQKKIEMGDKMKKICVFFIFILFMWFSMDMTGFKIGKFTLVEAAWNSIDGIWWLIFVSLSIVFVIKDKIGKYLLSIFMFLWLLIQFFSHWYFTIFGASDSKISSYNHYFEETYQIIPSSDTIIIPDLYHIVLHILITITMISLLVFFKYNRKIVSKKYVSNKY